MSLTPVVWSELTARARTALLQRPALIDDSEQRQKVQAIIDSVRARGDDALVEFAQHFDKSDIGSIRVSNEETEAASRQLSAASIAAIDTAIANVRYFHAAQMPQSVSVETMPGVVCERVSHALDSVGLYVPAGTAPLPSAAIMLAVPAVLAGCPKVVLCTPPRPDGTADPAVVVAASRAGISEIYKAGGAQAVAAMAYGTETVPKTLKIFGPGNSWVTMAKSLVASDVQGAAIDMPAGPSEVLVIADGSASAEFVASDLLSQAEHGADSQVILLTTSTDLAAAVVIELKQQLQGLSRSAIAEAALRHSRVIIVDTLTTAIGISNDYAPEHLILQLDNARDAVAKIRNAGSVFVGQWTPESVGDYCSGTNHVLPTYGYARNYSGLGIDQFVRQMTVQELSYDGLAGLGDTVVELAMLEGLDAHAQAVERRLKAGRP